MPRFPIGFGSVPRIFSPDDPPDPEPPKTDPVDAVAGNTIEPDRVNCGSYNEPEEDE